MEHTVFPWKELISLSNTGLAFILVLFLVLKFIPDLIKQIMKTVNEDLSAMIKNNTAVIERNTIIIEKSIEVLARFIEVTYECKKKKD